MSKTLTARQRLILKAALADKHKRVRAAHIAAQLNETLGFVSINLTYLRALGYLK